MSDEKHGEVKGQEPDQDLTNKPKEQADTPESNQPNETADLTEDIDNGGDTVSDISTEFELLKADNDKLIAENEQLKDAALRAQAEMQNVRQRAERDVEKARKYALEKFINELLPVADNLERALDAAKDNNDSQKGVIDGVDLTLRSLHDTLKQFGVKAIDPQNEPFNPQLHQAMSMVPNGNVEPNTVLNVFQKGYSLNGRLVRPAMVVVSESP